MVFQFAFVGDGVQDAGAFFASFEHYEVSIGKVNDIEKIALVGGNFLLKSPRVV